MVGVTVYLWRAIDDEGEILDVLVQHRRDCEGEDSHIHYPVPVTTPGDPKLFLLLTFLSPSKCCPGATVPSFAVITNRRQLGPVLRLRPK
jgi:hypothetical protein